MNAKALCAAALLATLSRGGIAAAQQPDEVVAESLFREGKSWFEQGNYAVACPKLAESYRLDPGTGSLLALAMCHEADGKLASAWVEYTDVVARSRREARPDREKAARERAKALESRLSRLVVVPSEGASHEPSLEIKLDGVALGRAALGSPILIDPGTHALEARAPGKKRWTMFATWDATPSTQTVVIPPLEDDVLWLPPPAAAARASEGSRSLTPLRAGALVAGGMGIAAVLLGGYFGVRAIERNHDSLPNCSATDCTPEARQLRLDARSDGNVSTAAFITAGALLGGGVVLWIWGSPEKESAAIAETRAGGATVGWRARF